MVPLTKQPIPDDEGTSIVLVYTVAVSTMVDPMVTWCVQYVL